jgi:hypothetical protein
MITVTILSTARNEVAGKEADTSDRRLFCRSSAIFAAKAAEL